MAGSAVITGGGGGLGKAFAKLLAHEGYDVVPVDIKGADRVLDVTDGEACRALAQDLRPTIWVNCAGVTGTGSLLEQSTADVERIVHVNLLGVIHGTRAAAATMLADGGGVILNIASLAGWAPTPHLSVYSATKHGVRALSVAAGIELRHTPVRVKCLLPDGIRTPMVDVNDSRQLMSFTGKRLLEPEEVAAAGIALMRSKRLVASVPPSRGVSVRLLGMAPRLAGPLVPFMERRARRNQARARAEDQRGDGSR